jgi:epoxide hydrolase 4
MSELRFSNVRVNGITLHLAEAGPDDGPLLFLLHGFPEYWRAWKDYILPFAAAGFHVIAPDQRGYNLSEKPKDIAAYDLDQLAADMWPHGFRACAFSASRNDTVTFGKICPRAG